MLSLTNKIPRGALSEISGPAGGGKTEFVMRALAERSGVRVAWVEKEFTAYPCAFPQHGIELHRILFIEAEKESFWAINQVLRSRLFGIVVASGQESISTVELRRLQIASEQTGASVILLNEEPAQGAWPISLQIFVNQRQPQVIKHRSGKQWNVASN